MARQVLPLWTRAICVGQFFKLLGEEQHTENMDLPDDLSTREHLVGYLNKLSEAVCEKQHSKEKILFCLSDSTILKDHPAGTICRPDFVAIRIGQGAKPTSPLSLVSIEESVTGDLQSENNQKLAWSQLETTGEIFSKGKTEAEAAAQGASYTAYLLQARPDLVSVVGLFFNFKRYHSSAHGIHSPSLQPEARLSIERTGDFPNKHAFTIDVDTHGKFKDCVLIRVGSPFHRRSTIFAAPQTLSSSSSSSSSSLVVIKSQYVEKGRRFKEGPILRRIHESYDFPGVVRLIPATGTTQGLATVEAGSEAFADSSRGSVANADGEERVAQVRDECPDADMTEKTPAAEEGISDAREDKTAPGINNAASDMGAGVEWPHSRRNKDTQETLLVLQDKADLLVDAETPLEALIAFYDLFEVTRFLHKQRKIFHRDISAGNVLLREKAWAPVKPFEDEFGDMCFARHLLGERGPDPDASQLHTRVLLIDFDMAEDRGAQSRQQSKDRSGTPMFMARLVRNPVVYEGYYGNPAMPQLQGVALKRYEACVGNRLSEFRKNDKSLYEIENDKNIEYSHRLSYEAEATMWLLFSWAMQVKPVEEYPESWIPDHLWGNLTGGEGATTDPRKYFLTVGKEAICHPVYQGLDQLLYSLRDQLSGYQEQVARPPNEQDPSRMKDEYLHEAFQRTIFDFIVKNVEESFMQKPINRTRRRRDPAGVMSQRIVTPSTGMRRNYDTMAGEGSQSSDQPNPIRPNPPNENPNFN